MRHQNLAEFLGLPGEPKPVGAWGVDERIMEWADVDFRGVGKIVDLPSPHTRQVSPTCYIDCWGVRREMIDGEWQITGYPLEGLDDGALEEYAWPEPRVDEEVLARWEDEARALNARGDKVILAEHPVLGIMELGCMMFGYEDYLLHLAMDPDLIRRFNDKVLEIQLEVSRQYYTVLGPHIDLTTSGDDFGTQLGLLISPDMWADMIAPYFTERIRLTKDIADCYYWHHSCGAISELLGQMIDCGVDIINPVQTSAAGMAPASLKEQFGDRIVFWGAMDVQQFLPRATPDDVRAHTRELVEVLGKDGGYVMAPAHQMPLDIPLETIVVWVEEVRAMKEKE